MARMYVVIQMLSKFSLKFQIKIWSVSFQLSRQVQSISSLASTGTTSLTATDTSEAATATEAIASLGFFAAPDVDPSSEEDEDDDDDDEEELLLSDLGES